MSLVVLLADPIYVNDVYTGHSPQGYHERIQTPVAALFSGGAFVNCGCGVVRGGGGPEGREGWV
jgi:hypothetical protein